MTIILESHEENKSGACNTCSQGFFYI